MLFQEVVKICKRYILNHLFSLMYLKAVLPLGLYNIPLLFMNVGQDCIRANSDGGNNLPNFGNPGNTNFIVGVNPIQVIIKSYEFHCCGRVGGWAAYVQPGGGGHTTEVYSINFQIWRPMGVNTFVKIGENSFPSLTLADNSLIEETPASSDQINFQPGDVVGYYLEDSRDQNGGVQFDSGFTSEELWYATGSPDLQNECLLEVGTAGDLSMSINLGPIISISLSEY